MRVLVIGAAGRVGSAALAACLAKNHTVTVFLRQPSLLPPEVREHCHLHIIQGDPSSHAALVEAIRDQDAIIQAAVYGTNNVSSVSESEKVIRCLIRAVKEVQASRRAALAPGKYKTKDRGSIRLWVLSGQVLKDIPGGRGSRIYGDVIPIHPEYYKDYAFLQQDARHVDWSLLCPGSVDLGEVRVVLYECR